MTDPHSRHSDCGEDSDSRTAERNRILELEKVNEQLSHFAWIAAHDLQEPMRKIIVFAKLLDQAVATSNTAEIEHAKNTILKAALGASELIDDILTYSRITNSNLEHEVLDLRERVERALDDLSQSILETGAEIDLQVSSTPFRADPSDFARLMQNILSNAIKYTKPGQKPKICIKTYRTNENIVLSITDEGIGFEQDFADVIFFPFRRLHGKSKYPG